ncbi:MAG: thiolase domain-containing protein, partial [Candidatus Bipolaricaulota bacterium]|nr:thiolase domain-containing protein [Candidatus Bipolaricaulota bacterium]
GVGQSHFGIRSDASLRELAFEAVKACIDDAGVPLADVQSMVVSVASDELSCALQPSAQVVDYIGFHPRPSFRVEGACASGSMAVRTGWMNIASGLADLVLVVGAEKMTEAPTARTTEVLGRAGDFLWEYPFGMTFPGYYALIAQAHMAKYGTTEAQLAAVAVKNHHYGALNPYAHMRKEITLEKAMGSFVVAAPLKLYDCCLISDGAAAILLASEKLAKRISKKPIWIRGLGLGTGSLSLAHREDLTTLGATVEAARQAYEMAGVGPKDIDVAVVHDCFTIAEIVAYEDLGFCPKGEGGPLVENRETYIGGTIPVNVDGGLKSKGHPIGTTGVSMAVEITKQLRGEADEGRQVPKAEVGLSHNVGGNGQHAVVHVFSRDKE